MPLTLSPDQHTALTALKNWYKDPAKKQFISARKERSDISARKEGHGSFITLGGYAGTGKTTLLSFLRQELDKIDNKLSVAFCSFTGKATQVLKRKLQEHNAIFKPDFIGTIHSLIYKTIEDVSGAVLGWELRDRDELNYDLIVVDEASMVDAKIWQDLLSVGIPIIAVGDHGQLPPINGTFNLMQAPELRLEHIHRQAQENPIIQLSIMAREQGLIPIGKYAPNVEKLAADDMGSSVEELFLNYNANTLILCGYNNTRVKINMAVRNALGFELPIPLRNDRVICLRNNHKKAIFNGMLGTLQSIKFKDKDRYKVEIALDGVDKVYEGLVSAEQFAAAKSLNNINGYTRTKDLDLFDFGYALTVHKAQGSQAKKVVLFEERFKTQDDDLWKRWLYTAVTRAEEELLIFG